MAGDRRTERIAELVSEVNQLRALVAEILDAADPDRGAETRIEAWRERAGMAGGTSEADA